MHRHCGSICPLQPKKFSPIPKSSTQDMLRWIFFLASEVCEAANQPSLTETDSLIYGAAISSRNACCFELGKVHTETQCSILAPLTAPHPSDKMLCQVCFVCVCQGDAKGVSGISLLRCQICMLVWLHASQ